MRRYISHAGAVSTASVNTCVVALAAGAVPSGFVDSILLFCEGVRDAGSDENVPSPPPWSVGYAYWAMMFTLHFPWVLSAAFAKKEEGDPRGRGHDREADE